ncbi:MAG TPA: hypothetical protein VME66_09960 [Candidatus Acidoferrales bacterium]|nr:hypothetical protein [Candidatus Acidoferrales bacterium]
MLHRIRALLLTITLLCVSAPCLAASTTMVPADDLISVQLQEEIGSRTSVEGDTFAVLTVEDYYARGKLVLPKGSPGYGVVTHVKRAGLFHSGGEFAFEVRRLIAPDGTEIMVDTNGATADADAQSEKNGNEFGAYIVFGVGGLLGRRGNDLQIKRGTLFHVSTEQQRDVPVVPWGTQPAKLDDFLVTPQR